MSSKESIMRILLLVFVFLFSCVASATQTVVWFGDSNTSGVSQGTAKQLSLHLVSAEQDVVIKNLSSPGTSLGHTDRTGYNSTRTVNAIDLARGAWNAYDVAVITAGTNDYTRWVPLADTKGGLRRILDKVRADGKRALLIPILWRGEEVGPNGGTPNGIGLTVMNYRWEIALTCIVEYPDVCHHANVNGSPLLTSAGANTDYDATETAQGKQLHLNASGHRKLADYIKLEINNMNSAMAARKRKI